MKVKEMDDNEVIVHTSLLEKEKVEPQKFYKIMDKSTGLFASRRNGKKRWNTSGAVYNSLNDLKCVWLEKFENAINKDDLVIVEYVVEKSPTNLQMSEIFNVR